MHTNVEESARDAKTVESLRTELGRCQRQRDECQQRMEHMECLFAHLADAIFVSDTHGRIIDVNPAASAVLGYSRQELLTMCLWDFAASASRDEILGLIQNLRRETTATVQRTYRCKSGEQKVIDLRLTRCDLAGRDLMVVSCRDITERKRLEDRLLQNVTERARAEAAVRRSEDHLRLVIDTIPGLVWSARPDGHIEYLNQRWIEFTGLALATARGWGWQAAVHADDLPGLVDYWKSILASGQPGETEARLRRFDGTYRWFLFRGVPLRDELGKLSQWYGTNTDIEDRKWAEALLAGEKRVLEMIAHGHPLPSILEALCRLVEELSCGCLCSILLLESDSNRLWHGAAPSLPASFTTAIDGSPIGPATGPCGRAAHLKTPVIASDIATDPAPAELRDLALRHGLRACWSTPILSSDGRVLGTFAIYSREPRAPRLEHDRLTEQITHVAAAAIERKKSEQALRASDHLAHGQLNALKNTLDALAQESELDKFLEYVLRTITEQLDAHSSSVWRREEASGLVVFQFAFENDRLITRSNATLAAISPSLPIDDLWPWPEIFRSGKPSVLADIREGPDFPWRKHLLSQGVITILIIPMLIAGQVDGVIGIRFTRQRTFRAEEMELAQALAHQAMLAMQLTRLSAQSRQSAVMAERNRLARDIHDTLAQGFTGVIVQLEAAGDATAQGLHKEAGDHLRRASELARDNLKEARRSVQALRPLALEDKNLCQALEDLIRKMTAGATMRATFALQGRPRPLPAEWEENLLRIGQEVLTNALRHAHASEFKAQLVFAAEEIRLELRDNGRGFDPERKQDGFGLLGMRERVEAMGGQIFIQSADGAGAAILIALPLTSQVKDAAS